MSEQIDITKKTTSKRRQESSRANGAKSHGPVTPEGKARSSQNARTHGCLSSILTRTPEEFVSLGNIRHGYELRYRPRDQSEWDLVEQAVIANWKMRDCWVKEEALLQTQMAIDEEDVRRAWPEAPEVHRAALAFVECTKDSAAIDRLHRYARNYAMQADRAIKLLLVLQAQRIPPGANLAVCGPDAQAEEDLRIEPSPKNEQKANKQNQQDTKTAAQSEAPAPDPKPAAEYIFSGQRTVVYRKGGKLVSRLAPEPEPPTEIDNGRQRVCAA